MTVGTIWLGFPTGGNFVSAVMAQGVEGISGSE